MSKFIVKFHMKSGKTIEINNVDSYKFEAYQDGKISSYEINRNKKENPIFWKIDMNQIEAITVHND